MKKSFMRILSGGLLVVMLAGSIFGVKPFVRRTGSVAPPPIKAGAHCLCYLADDSEHEEAGEEVFKNICCHDEGGKKEEEDNV